MAIAHEPLSGSGTGDGLATAAGQHDDVHRFGDNYGSPPDRYTVSNASVGQIARGLGWFSIGLGLAEVLAPGSVARLTGIDDSSRSRAILRLAGMREIATGAGILSSRQPTGWLWVRVAGDAMDLALLGSAMNSDDNDRDRLIGATTAVLGVAALDVLAGQRFSSDDDVVRAGSTSGRPKVTKYVTINRPIEEVYAFWRDFENLPRFMQHLESVQVVDDGLSHWVAKAPLGRTVSWNARLTADEPHRHIAWRSLEGADVENSGWVHFSEAPGGRGTEVRVQISYALPGGKAVDTLAHLFPENPEREVYDDLRAFKQVMETGEVVQSVAVAAGSRLRQHPAQPAER